jgi:16S rRNA (uracil1498-N3)-methyltransferase
MNLPYFYIPVYKGEKQLILNEETSRHISQVLRMKEGEKLNLTDGRGKLLSCEIMEAAKKQCIVHIREATEHTPWSM